MEKIPKFDKRRAFNKAVGPGKNPKLISIGPTFIPDCRVAKVDILSKDHPVFFWKEKAQMTTYLFVMCNST